MWNDSVQGLRHDCSTERIRSEKANTPTRGPRLGYSALGMPLWTCTRKCTNAGPMGATAEPSVGKDSVGGSAASSRISRILRLSG